MIDHELAISIQSLITTILAKGDEIAGYTLLGNLSHMMASILQEKETEDKPASHLIRELQAGSYL